MGTEKLIERELPQWVKSIRRHAHFAQAIETEELADAELDVQLGMIDAMAAKPANGPVDILLKLKIWESYVAPNGSQDDLPEEAKLIFSVIRDLEAFVDTNGGSMATYPGAHLAKVS